MLLLQMHVDREAMARQSAVLMTSAASDQRLMEALMKVEDLTRELESQKQSHQEEVRLCSASLLLSQEIKADNGLTLDGMTCRSPT